MEIKRKATAVWNGTGKTGSGKLSTQSGVLENTQYSFHTRFEDGIGTNPEELIGAAHAGCFSMKLAFNLQAAEITPQEIKTEAVVILENGAIGKIELNCTVSAEGLTSEKLEELAQDAKANCPISKLLNADIQLSVQLIP